MAYLSTSFKPPVSPGMLNLRIVRAWVTAALAEFRAAQATKAAIRKLRTYPDSQLADMGIQRADLVRDRFEKAADLRARAMLRIYRG